jgi:hypothetical protein
MELLKEVANISGKGGLYRILKPGRSGVIVESMDAKKKREMVPATARVSVLKDISIYQQGVNDSMPLGDIFLAMREKFGEKIELDTKVANTEEFYSTLGEVMPDFDRERVHASDVKKLINWYNLLSVKMPELWDVTEEEEVKEEVKVEEKTEEVAEAKTEVKEKKVKSKAKAK